MSAKALSWSGCSLLQSSSISITKTHQDPGTIDKNLFSTVVIAQKKARKFKKVCISFTCFCPIKPSANLGFFFLMISSSGVLRFVDNLDRGCPRIWKGREATREEGAAARGETWVL